jgi:prepilin-type N-terminal cleavage/methylation domain-containing protein
MIKRSNKKGFTLVELMIVITVIAILVTIGVVSFSRVQAQSRDTKRKADMRALQTAMQAYFTETQSYPADGTLSTTLVPTYLPSLPVDPQTKANYEYDNNAALYALCSDLETASASADKWIVSTANPGGYGRDGTGYTCTAE